FKEITHQMPSEIQEKLVDTQKSLEIEKRKNQALKAQIKFIKQNYINDLQIPEPIKKVINLKKIEIHQQLAVTGGSFATIYSCTIDGWKCAMKEMDLVIMDLDTFHIENFKKEIKLMEKLPVHKNLVRYLFYTIDNTHIRLFMTLYDSSMSYILEQRSKLSKKFKPNDISRFLKDILSGLEILHENRIIHRDLKLCNIFVSKNQFGDIENLCIGDFDTARFIGYNKVSQTICGTFGYTAPEVNSGTSYSFPADIWSIGVIAFELVTFEPPVTRCPNYKESDVLKQLIDSQDIEKDVLPNEFKHIEKMIQGCLITDPDYRASIDDCKSILFDFGIISK
ncbi:MAG: hypothetical protein Satyrvirus21_1, partial [Satyrvirus sp.]